MAGPTSENTWTWLETVKDYEVWHRPVAGGHVYQVTKCGDPPPKIYAGYANKHALLRMKGIL